MLRELRIENFAIIHRLEIPFDRGLTVLTGETGSGKSIVVDALGLLLGGRSSAGQIRSGCDEAVLEGFFEVPSKGPVSRLLLEADLSGDPADELIIRRVLSRNGRSRCYINGRLSTLSQLQALGNLLADIHGQNEHQSLLRPELQLYFLDAYGKLLEKRDDFLGLHREYRRTQEELRELETLERDRLQREDLLQFQEQEIREAGLSPGEDIGLQQERDILGNAERLAVMANEAYQALYGGDGALLEGLEEVGQTLEKLVETDGRLSDISSGCAESIVQLREASSRLRDYKDEISFDPARLEEVESRLHRIEDLKKKYAGTIEGILKRGEEVRSELETLRTNDERVRSLREKLEKDRAAMVRAAGRLSSAREKTAGILGARVEEELGRLKMEKTRFVIHVNPVSDPDQFGPSGADTVEILVSANAGEEPRPLSRVASGGELSRIMLSVKTILSGVDRIPILVFDEVDSGVGGVVAGVVGNRLKGLSRNRQVFCITHLPQIASQADAHYTVEKRAEKGRTVAGVRPLDPKGRVEEIARMLGGRKSTPAAFKHAREMLNQNTA
ncbi:MAG TPA: DNA repair protein RecN [Nitrospiria bacterium]